MQGEDIKTKVCRECGRELPLTEEYFKVHPKSKDGFCHTCRKCQTPRRVLWERFDKQLDEEINKRLKNNQYGTEADWLSFRDWVIENIPEYKYYNGSSYRAAWRNRAWYYAQEQKWQKSKLLFEEMMNLQNHRCPLCEKKIYKKDTVDNYVNGHDEHYRPLGLIEYVQEKDCVVTINGEPHGTWVHRECASKKWQEQHGISNKDYDKELKEYKCQWYLANKERVLQRQKERRAENPQAHAESQAKWRKANKDKINEQVRNRKENDPIYKLKCQARCTIYQSFARRGEVKNSRCESVTGTSIDNLVSHLLQTYTDIYGRTWDGKEAVHIDHIIPISSAETEEDVIKLCHYTNLQLLKAEDNMVKSNKLNYQIGGN